ncbi:MAG TPA: hypothetical protein VE129_16105, partial [Thermoanaerobaculia bacterium]|nr:hypothetical protein [Thermoanaerobaculia bacterium]
MNERDNQSPFRRKVSRAVRALAVSGLVTLAVPADADPPGNAAELPTPVSFVDASTLVRDMTRQQVVVSADGRSEQKIVVPAKYCASLVPGASKSVNLADVRWGLRTTTQVPITRRTRVTLRWPGQPHREEVLADGMPGSSERAFTFPRPGPRSVQVTLFPVGGLQPVPGRPTGSITDGTSNTVTFGEKAAPTPSVPTAANGGVVTSRPPATSTSSIKNGTSNTISLGTRPGVP